MRVMTPRIFGWQVQIWRGWRARPHPQSVGALRLEEWGMTEYFAGPICLVHFYRPIL